VRDVYDTQRVLERESQALQAELATLTRELGSWGRKTQVCWLRVVTRPASAPWCVGCVVCITLSSSSSSRQQQQQH
jgi:hypothetical protein